MKTKSALKVEPDLELAKTKLQVIGGELQRLNEEDGIVTRLPLAAVESVRFTSRLDLSCLVTMALGGGLWLIGWAVSEYNVITCLLYVGGLFLFGTGLMGIRDSVIVIRSEDEVLKIVCRDSDDEGQGFVISLERLLNEVHTEGAVAADSKLRSSLQ